MTLSRSTCSWINDACRFGSPPSSEMMYLILWHRSPPAALVAAAQACTVLGSPDNDSPSTPDIVLTDPITSGDRSPVHAPGAAGAEPGPGAAPGPGAGTSPRPGAGVPDGLAPPEAAGADAAPPLDVPWAARGAGTVFDAIAADDPPAAGAGLAGVPAAGVPVAPLGAGVASAEAEAAPTGAYAAAAGAVVGGPAASVAFPPRVPHPAPRRSAATSAALNRLAVVECFCMSSSPIRSVNVIRSGASAALFGAGPRRGV